MRFEFNKSLGQIALNIHRRRLANMLAFPAFIGGHPGVVVIAVCGVLAAAIHQKVFFFKHHGQDIGLDVLEIGGELDGRCRAGLFAQTAVDAAAEVDPKPARVAPPVRLLGALHADAAHRADCRAEVAGHATLASVRITGQYDSCPRAFGKLPLDLRV